MTATVAALCRQLLGAGPLSISKLADLTHDNVAEVGAMLLRMRESGVVKMTDEGWLVADEPRVRALAHGRPLDADGLRISSLCANCGAASSFMVTWRRER